MLVILLSVLSFSLPCPFYHTHEIKVIPHELYDRYREAQKNCLEVERRAEYAFLDGPFKEYLTKIKEFNSNAADSLHDLYKDMVDHEYTFDVAYDAKSLANSLNHIPSDTAAVEIVLCINVTDDVDFGQLSQNVHVKISSNLDEDLENDILAYNENIEDYNAYLIRIDAIKTGKLPNQRKQSRKIKTRRPKIYTKSYDKVNFNILGGDYSNRIISFNADYNIVLNISNNDFVVNQIDSFNMVIDGQNQLKSKSIVVSPYTNVTDLILNYKPTTVYFRNNLENVNDTTIEFYDNNWTITSNNRSVAVLKKQGSVKECGYSFYIEDINDINLYLPQVNEIAGGIKFEIKHNEDFYELYYYFLSRGVEYDYKYEDIPELYVMIEELIDYHFPDSGDSKLLLKKDYQNFRLTKKVKSNLLSYDSNKEFKKQVNIKSTGFWDQVKTLPNITFEKPNHVTIDKTNLQSNVNWNDHIYEESNDNPESSGNSPKKSKKSSSNNNNDDDDFSTKQSSFTLANFSIHDVYVGASTILEFPFGFKVMRLAREKFGHFIPPPNFLHTAVWVGPYGSNNQTLGSILVYGKYSSKNDDKTYLSKDGARSFVMTLREFIEYFDYCNIKKLTPQRNLHLFDLINEVKNSGNWNVAKYH